MLTNKIYYHLKPFIPRTFQIIFRRQIALIKKLLYRNIWPIDEKAGRTPDGWAGWPGQKRFALVLTHDVETAEGLEKYHKLMDLEKTLGFRSSFYFVPERYRVPAEILNHLTSNGFEVGVHGLCHDGKLFQSKKTFRERCCKINQYLKEWNAIGFRSPSMHHNLEWISGLNIEYDASTFDTDPFEPQSDGVKTIFPFWVEGNSNHRRYLELPYTLPQDFTLFVLCRETNDIWKQKLDWIVSKGGMVLMNTHPDYMFFDTGQLSIEEYPADYYAEFLEHIKHKFNGLYWHALPREMALFCSSFSSNASS